MQGSFQIFGCSILLILASNPVFPGWLLQEGVSQEPQARVSLRAPVISLSIDRGGSVFAGTSNRITVFDRELEHLQTLPSELAVVHDLLVIDQVLIAAGGNPAEQGMLECYSVEHPYSLQRRKIGHPDVIHSVCKNRNRLLAASSDGSVSQWSLAFQPGLRFQDHSKRVLKVLPLPGSELVLSAGMDNTIRLWDPASGKTLRTLMHHQADVLDMASRGNLQGPPMVASVSRDRTVRFWQPTLGRMVRFKRLEQVPTSILWRADSGEVICGTSRGDVVSIDATTLELRRIAKIGERVYSLAAAGDRLYVGSSRSLALFSLQDDK